MSTQSRLPDRKTVRGLRIPDIAYTLASALFADGEGYVWIKADAPILDKPDERFSVRICKNKDGFVVVDQHTVKIEQILEYGDMGNRDIDRKTNVPVILVV